MLSTRPFNISLELVYLVYLAFGIWGCYRVEEGITLDRLAGDDSYVADYYDEETKYFREYCPVISVNVAKKLDLWKTTERGKIDSFAKAVRSLRLLPR